MCIRDSDKIALANEVQRWETGWSDTTNVVVLPRWLQLLEAEF
jgi:hypothetical protein